MWTSQVEQTDSPNTLKITIHQSDQPMRFDQVFHAWQGDTDFRNFYIHLVADAPFDALFWEHPPITRHSVTRPYEFIVADSPALATVIADPQPFADRFAAQPDEGVLTFENLGGDALLVVPSLVGQAKIYPHLLQFLRASAKGLHDQQHLFLQRIGKAIETRLSNQPLWVSTSGLGVYWLHVRLDWRPKYYTYRPYKLA